MLFRNGSIFDFFELRLGQGMGYVGLFGMCLLLVVMSFLFHEFGHKFMAQKYGLWSEFRMWPIGLVLTLVTSLIGFLFASPGAVMIAGNMDKKMNGMVSIAGPAVNIVLCVIGIIGWLATNGTDFVIFFYMLTSLNAWLAIFNLIPVPPLDGSKIIYWNLIVWGVAIGIAVALFLLMRFVLPAPYYYI
ncbi:MAG: site-2 protease family protein [Candidatus Methanomethylophilaceae archaeon]|nr:site-2 protease family protein [Candidatus Methanomethylophilaceae archaeon]MBP5735721.1 site-2 protease family protein [Candidatus Methanomethylophilaceae archaeon]